MKRTFRGMSAFALLLASTMVVAGCGSTESSLAEEDLPSSEVAALQPGTPGTYCVNENQLQVAMHRCQLCADDYSAFVTQFPRIPPPLATLLVRILSQNCRGRVCGQDLQAAASAWTLPWTTVCGGQQTCEATFDTCGTACSVTACGANEQCVGGTCKCTPSCPGLVCDAGVADGCGGVCALTQRNCPDPELCTPASDLCGACDHKVCHADETCDDNGACVANCTKSCVEGSCVAKDDGCGGACPVQACDAGSFCSSEGVCSDCSSCNRCVPPNRRDGDRCIIFENSACTERFPDYPVERTCEPSIPAGQVYARCNAGPDADTAIASDVGADFKCFVMDPGLGQAFDRTEGTEWFVDQCVKP